MNTPLFRGGFPVDSVSGFSSVSNDFLTPEFPSGLLCHISPPVHFFQSSDRHVITKRPPLMIICQKERWRGEVQDTRRFFSRCGFAAAVELVERLHSGDCFSNLAVD